MPHNLLKFLDSLDLPLLPSLSQRLHQLLQQQEHHLHLLPANLSLNYNLDSVPFLNNNPDQLVAYKTLRDPSSPPGPKELFLLQPSVMDYPNSFGEYHNNSRVNLDHNFNNHFNQDQVNLEHLLPLHQGLNNLKQDPLKVLQSDHHHKGFNNALSNLEPLEDPLQDFKADPLPLQLDFQCLTQPLSEVHASRYSYLCES